MIVYVKYFSVLNTLFIIPTTSHAKVNMLFTWFFQNEIVQEDENAKTRTMV